MKNYIEIDDKLVISDGDIEISNNNTISKEIVEEENRLESINKEINHIDKRLKEDSNSSFNTRSSLRLISFFAFFLLIMTDIAVYNTYKVDPSMINMNGFIKANVILTIITVGTISISAINKHLFKKKKDNYELENEILIKMKEETEEKIKALNKSKKEIKDFSINKTDTKELLKSIRNELESFKNIEIEKNKEKSIGTR